MSPIGGMFSYKRLMEGELKKKTKQQPMPQQQQQQQPQRQHQNQQHQMRAERPAIEIDPYINKTREVLFSLSSQKSFIILSLIFTSQI